MCTLRVLSIFTFIIIVSSFTFAQQEVSKDELTSSVPELEKYHEVIYPIWHEAYPDKDYAKLRSYLNEVLTGANEIYSAKLPGILRDKQAKWDAGIVVFRASVDSFKLACEGTDNELLLLMAEKLHANYEMLVRIIRPLMKEVDAFHQSLYVLYHNYLPKKKYDKILRISDELITKAEAILTAKLSKKVESKKEQFLKNVAILVDAAKNLKTTAMGNDTKLIDEAVEKLHTAYVNIEEMFN